MRLYRAVLGAVTILSAITTTPLHGQQDTTRLEPVVTVARSSGTSVLRSPFAITVVTPDSSRPGQRHASVDESLALIPGISVTSRNNPAQDPRLSIRGFGARSAFGVRGVRILRDGIPITLPDGQTPLDYVSLESVERIEVLRGAASALYGNASGGVVDLHSRSPSAATIDLAAKQWFAGNSSSRSVVTASGSIGRAGYVADVTRATSDGSRRHSQQRSTSAFLRTGLKEGDTHAALTVMALSNPLSQNPGALTLDEMLGDASQADASSVRRDARKSVNQLQIGLSGERRLGSGSLSVSGFGGSRSLDNPLTFGIVEVGRHSYGMSASARGTASLFRAMHSFSTGIDYQSQNDLRRNYATCIDTVAVMVPVPACPYPGEDRGVVTLDQRELVSSVGAYVSDAVAISPRVNVSVGLRADRIRFEVRDRLVNASNTDDSGDRTLDAVSPVAGIVANVAPTQSVYANISSAFETPTATELGNQADGSAGLNQELDPQRSTTIEAGARGWMGARVRYDVSLFETRVRDELVPFEIPSSNGRRYFRNAGRTLRRGAEAGLDVASAPLTVMLAYTYSHFRFEEYALGGSDFSGNAIPGLPSQRLQAAARLDAGSLFAVVETETAGRSYVDDANSGKAPGYFVAHARAGMERPLAHARYAVTVGVQNAFDRTYASSIAVNAARGRYYEPAPRRTFFVGVTVGAILR